MLPKKKHQLFEDHECAKLDSNMVNSENFFCNISSWATEFRHSRLPAVGR
jgi:hypothetical protein